MKDKQDMDIEELRNFCCSLPAVTEDIKWGNNLVFSVAGKMFCLADLDPPMHFSFKVDEDKFYELTESPGIIQAPYFARNMWVLVTNTELLTNTEWHQHIRRSYELVKLKLPKKLRDSI